MCGVQRGRNYLQYTIDRVSMCAVLLSLYLINLSLGVMRLIILNIIFSGVIIILAYKSAITFRFTLWLLSVMNNSIKD